MKLRWLIPFVLVLPLPSSATPVTGRVTTIVIDPSHITRLHLRPEFESVIRMPEEITSIILGSPGTFKAEHNEGEPTYVYVKPITKEPSQSNLLIATKSGVHVSLELISDGAVNNSDSQPVDFLIEYHVPRSFLVATSAVPLNNAADSPRHPVAAIGTLGPATQASSAIDLEYQQQIRINSPAWTKWEGKQIQTALGDTRQWDNEVAVSYSILNSSDLPVEIVPPQIQIAGHSQKKKKKKGTNVTSDQLEIREYRLSATRLEPGARADGVVLYDRPNFKQSTEKLFLQIAQADQIDQPILIRLPFTPAINASTEREDAHEVQ